jgi:hypothetical protein
MVRSGSTAGSLGGRGVAARRSDQARGSAPAVANGDQVLDCDGVLRPVEDIARDWFTALDRKHVLVLAYERAHAGLAARHSARVVVGAGCEFLGKGESADACQARALSGKGEGNRRRRRQA